MRITEFHGRGGIRQEGRLKREKTPEATEPVLLPPVGSQVGHGKGGSLRAGQEAGGFTGGAWKRWWLESGAGGRWGLVSRL